MVLATYEKKRFGRDSSLEVSEGVGGNVRTRLTLNTHNQEPEEVIVRTSDI
jgi:hypothetical protein